ncbi:stage III sporulation protein AE [Clostridium saccharobutylicum]|uniref:Stage III sporulation protein AE n=1 Tax=Clostridium saccharobutylicum DSM 13864 TaxID=1345695 RepID=U5MSV0_CLOSA|nr:stage III sporulation protein AE [Clostridium saccharobutylicum]AGX43665.1 stage III sporulation protein AE [Clostridium saccharobutylicum DSM 13864]AQR90963.1 stage III sporulation protein AE precursor [Clostridium saccharobutylicum]AQS00867.1 stage III sporulation protein AE precursor [Clostridium saccharobutylicum]AQS10523.1 stage III sporulation protein AE precursor [Clostridium saccharobutylicum]AQS14850.1 stage III sporulation protein AE precursor [Clostridium saccharobutylicum]
MKIIKRFTIVIILNLIITMIISIVPMERSFLKKCVYAAETADYKNNITMNNETTQNQEQSKGNLDSKVSIDDLGGSAKEQIDSLYKYINNMKTDVELMQNLNPVDYIKTYIANGKGNLSFDVIGKAVLSLVFKEVKSVLKLIISVVTIAIICSLLKNLQDAFSGENISQVAFYACYALIIVVLAKSFIISISVAKEVISNISDFMSALLPILVTMIGLTGGVAQATTLDPIVLACVVFIPKVYSNIIIPMILMGFMLEFANNLSTEHKITNLCGLLKQCTLWFQGIIITIFIALLTIRGITSKTIDAVTLKTAKFAIDNFIPIVGKTFSDAIASVAGYSLIIKNAISSMGLVVIVLLLLYPIVKLVLMTFIYKLSAALVEPISDSRITKCLESAASSMILITSCVLCVSLMFFILIAIMAASGSYVVGG